MIDYYNKKQLRSRATKIRHQYIQNHDTIKLDNKIYSNICTLLKNLAITKYISCSSSNTIISTYHSILGEPNLKFIDTNHYTSTFYLKNQNITQSYNLLLPVVLNNNKMVFTKFMHKKDCISNQYNILEPNLSLYSKYNKLQSKIELSKMIEAFENYKNGILHGNISNVKMYIDFIPQICIVPGVCFNHQKYRVGMGKGYYDRYLSTYKSHVKLKIGVCYDSQIINFDNKIMSKYDALMDYIVTDRQIIF